MFTAKKSLFQSTATRATRLHVFVQRCFKRQASSNKNRAFEVFRPFIHHCPTKRSTKLQNHFFFFLGVTQFCSYLHRDPSTVETSEPGPQGVKSLTDYFPRASPKTNIHSPTNALILNPKQCCFVELIIASVDVYGLPSHVCHTRPHLNACCLLLPLALTDATTSKHRSRAPRTGKPSTMTTASQAENLR